MTFRTFCKEKPEYPLPPGVNWIKAIGPFNLEDELALLQSNKITVMVSKNSGGDATVAKLEAARQLDIPVLMFNRPELPSADEIFISTSKCEQFVLQYKDQHAVSL